MEARTQRIRQIFEPEGCLVVPVFQRPYVWSRLRNWEPLWEDILTMVEAFTHDTATEPHFLGAVVLDGSEKNAADISIRQVIDGQQRLTTIQIVLCAARDALIKAGADERLIGVLRRLTTNEDQLSDAQFAPYKVWPTLRDREPFRAIVDDLKDVKDADSDSRLLDAYDFFYGTTIDWLDENRDDHELHRTLVTVLRTGLQMVVIELTESDNAQVIFESLNDRGTPLLPSDLIKNSLFQQLEHTGANVEQIFDDHWQRFETTYWQEEVRQGRLLRSRLDAFFGHFLTMRTGTEVPAGNLFNSFKSITDGLTGAELVSLTADIAESSELYKDILTAAPGRPHRRLMVTAEALDTTVLSPVVLHLERTTDDADRAEAYGYIESWLVRRALLRSTSKNYNRMLLDLLQVLKQHGGEPLAPIVRDFFLDNRSESGRWPDDNEVREVLIAAPLFNQLTRARVRLALQGCEAGLEWPSSEGLFDREAVVAQLKVDPSELDESLIPTLGNLTLVPSPRPRGLSTQRTWQDRRRLFSGESALNSDLPEILDSMEITERAAMLADGFCFWWPHPSTDTSVLPRASRPRTDEPENASSGVRQEDPIMGYFQDLPVGTVAPAFDLAPEGGLPIHAAALEAVRGAGYEIHEIHGSVFVEKTAGEQQESTTETEGTSSPETSSGLNATVRSRSSQPASSWGAPEKRITVADLLQAGLIVQGDRLYHEHLRSGRIFTATIGNTGTIIAGSAEYNSPSTALSMMIGTSRNGWTDWRVERTNETLAQIREAYGRQRQND